MNPTNTIQLKVYRDNKLSRAETYMPVITGAIHANIVLLGKKIDHWFVTQGHWPTRQELQAELAGDAETPSATMSL